MAETKPDIRHLSHQAYFDLEQAQDQRYEYLAGDIFAMVGGTESHALIGANSITAFSIALRDSPCRVYGSDMKLHIAEHDMFCYPDLMVLCEQGRRSKLYVEDPLLILEVLSDSTESYDRGLKFEHYRSMPTLRHYLLVSQGRMHAELFTRDSDAVWRFQESTGEQARVELEALGVSLSLAEIYRNVDLSVDPLEAFVPPAESRE